MVFRDAKSTAEDPNNIEIQNQITTRHKCDSFNVEFDKTKLNKLIISSTETGPSHASDGGRGLAIVHQTK